VKPELLATSKVKTGGTSGGKRKSIASQLTDHERLQLELERMVTFTGHEKRAR